MKAGIWCILGALMGACGGKGAVDLGGNRSDAWANVPAAGSSTETAPGEPTSLYSCNSDDCGVLGIAVSETTLAAALVTKNGPRIDLCQLPNCQGTIQHIDAVPVELGPLLIEGDEVLWFDSFANGLHAISACSVAGCAGGPRHIVTTDQPIVGSLAADANQVYWAEYTASGARVMRQLRTGPAAPAALDLPCRRDEFPDSPWPSVMQISATAGLLFLATTERILSIPADFSAAASVVYESPIPIRGVTLSGDYLYLALSSLKGQIARCAVDDCADTAQMLFDAPRWPATIAVDASEIYWTYREEGNTAGDGILGGAETRSLACSTLEQPMEAHDLVQSMLFNPVYGLVMNSRSLFWCDQDTKSHAFPNRIRTVQR